MEVISYDSVQCSIQYHGSENFDYYSYEVHDYFGTSTFFDANSGDFSTSVSSQLDTAFDGTEDWIIDSNNSKQTCYQSYCEFTCIVSRSLSSLDSSNDTQFSKGESVSVRSGYTVWKDRSETAPSANNSKGISNWRTVTLVEAGVQLLSLASVLTALISSYII